MAESTPPPPDVLGPLFDAGIAAIRHKLDEQPRHHHLFDEIAVFAQCLHKGCSALEPMINLPTPKTAAPLAPSPATEGYGASMAREIIAAVKSIGAPKPSLPSRKDLIIAIAHAKKEGLVDEAQFLCDELYALSEVIDFQTPDAELGPREKLDRANALIARGRTLIDSITEAQIIDEKRDAPAPS